MTTGAIAFCRDVLAGRDPGPLPAEGPQRSEILGLLGVHRLLGIWLHGRVDAPRAPTPAPGFPDVSDDAALEIQAALAHQALQTELTLEAAERAGGALRAGGFDALAFKGVGLIRAGVYPDPRARALGDADLLVRGGALGRAVQCLEEVGFVPWVPWTAGRGAWLPAFTLSDARAPEGLEITVDLHWRLEYGAFRSSEDRKDPSLWDGADLERGLMAPELHAILLAEHVIGHLRVVPHPIGVADLVRILPRVSDPERLGRLARARHSLRPIQALLWLVREELGVELDERLTRAVHVPPRLGRMKEEALSLERMLSPGHGRRQGRVVGVITQGLLQGSARDFLREVVRVVHPPDEWLTQRGSSAGTSLGRRVAYWLDLVRWAIERKASPLSPNQEFEGHSGLPRVRDLP